VALSGHGRPIAIPAGRAAIDGTLAEVRIERDGTLVARGSAVVVAARDEAGQSACYLLTVGHVLSAAGDDEASIGVVLPGAADAEPISAESLGTVDRGDQDLAVLRTIAAPCRPARIGPSLPPGADVWLGGFPAPGAPRILPGHVRDAVRAGHVWTVEGIATEGTSGGGVFDARSGALVGLIQGYWAVRLVAPGGRVAGEASVGRIAVIPIAGVRELLEAWGFVDLLESEPSAGQTSGSLE